MLKRNGEVCQHKVSGYSGLLTPSEYKAYGEVYDGERKEIELFKKHSRFFSEMEKIISALDALAKMPTRQNRPVITMRNKEEWQILITIERSLEHKPNLLFCSRETDGKRMFSMIEKFAPDAVIKSFQGIATFLAISQNHSLVLKHFLDRERYSIELDKRRLELNIAEGLFKRYPAHVCRRACKAIACLYEKQQTVETENVSVKETAIGAKMKV